MTDRPASWRFPTMKQIQKLGDAPVVGKNAPPTPAVGPGDDLPDAYWEALLGDAPADAVAPGKAIRARRLSEIGRHVLRVSCRRCGRIVEIQKVDALRLYGPEVVWKDVGQRLLDNACTWRTGRHEEDGCWPAFEWPLLRLRAPDYQDGTSLSPDAPLRTGPQGSRKGVG
jgi:hypothetical protein